MATKEILEARVMQKKDTEANWLANPLILLAGEQAFVVSSSGAPMNFKIGDGSKKFSELPYWIQYDQAAWVGVTGNTLPNPTQSVAYTILGPGTYTQTGGPSIVVPDNYMSTLTYNGTIWSKNDDIDLPTVEVSNSYGSRTGVAISEAKATATENKVSSVTSTNDGSIVTPVEFTLVAGNYSNTSGNFAAGVNWVSTNIVTLPAGSKKVRISGYGPNTTARAERVVCFSATAYISSIGTGNNTGVIDVDLPTGTTRVAIKIDGGTGIGSDLPNSPYQTSFKMFSLVSGASSYKINTSAIVDRIDTSQLINLETQVAELNNDKGNKYFDGHGYPSVNLGVDTDKYLDLDSMRLYIKANGSWGDGIFTGGEENFDYPSEWTFKPFSVGIQSNGYYAPKWTGLFNEKVLADYQRLTKYFVDPVNGLDTNTGLTETQAFKNLGTAISTKGARNIILLPCVGFYPRLTNLGNIVDINTTDPLIIRGTGNVCMAASDKGNTFTWTDTGNGVFSTSRTNCNNVFDTSKKDAKGNYFPLKKVDTLALCQSTTDSWYTNGTLLYVHRAENITPSSQYIEVCLSTFNRYVPNVNVPYIYMEGINFYSTNANEALGIENNATTQYNTAVYLKNIGGHNNIMGDGIGIDNIKDVILENCSGWGNLRDGLNYHTSKVTSGYQLMKVIEINGAGGNSGIGSVETSSNGSTTHEGMTIMRLNSKFDTGRGSLVADVNDGAMSLNLGVVANNSILEGDACFRINGAGSKMWLYGCIAKAELASVKSINANTGSTAYKDSKTKAPNGITGNVIDI